MTINGRIVQKSTGTADKTQAQEFHDRLKTQLWDQLKLGNKPRYSWNDAVVRWLNETQHKASRNDDLMHLRWLDQHFDQVPLDGINRDFLDQVIQAKLETGVANGTVNRMLALIRAILRKAALEWDWLDKTPKIRLLPEPTRRVRWITRQKAERLIDELPPHLKAMVRFSLETGLRQSNVTGLQWSQIDLARRCAWIHPDQAKAKKAIAVPLSKTAVVIVREQIGKHDSHVFTYHGKPVSEVNTKAWRNALKRAGITDFRWHDLRHTWASWHVQAGTPLHVLQELGGWESVEMVRRYAHLSSAHLAEYVDRLSAIRAIDDESIGYDLATVNKKGP
ncbi:tyrosine-type recombinase/integrase [Methylomarinum vadi]|uniref:tyrosine-type recombinase/integrase n=1 Tax=Methylomarinum vadi TaxID=438855 RepID=UPI00389966AD